MNLATEFTIAEQLFWDEAKSHWIPEKVIEDLIRVLSLWKGKHPFFIECGHHTIKPTLQWLSSVDFFWISISDHPGIQASFRLWALAKNLRQVKKRTAELVVSLSDLHHTQKNPELRQQIWKIAKEKTFVEQLLEYFHTSFDKIPHIKNEGLKIVTQSEWTKKARNKIRSLLSSAQGQEKAKKLFEERWIIVLHGKIDDSIEVILITTPESRNSHQKEIHGWIPLLTRSGPEEEWQTECGPTVAGIQHVIFDTLWANNPHSSILTIDDFADDTIGLKSIRWIWLVNTFVWSPSDSRHVLTDLKWQKLFLSSKKEPNWGENFENIINVCAEELLNQWYSSVNLYGESTPIKNRSSWSKIPLNCNTGFCSL